MRYPSLVAIANKPAATVTAAEIEQIVAALRADPRVVEIAGGDGAVRINAHFDGEDIDGVYSAGRAINAANFEPAPKVTHDDLLGTHADIRIDLISGGKTFQLVMPRNLNRSDRLKESAGGRWHADSTAWRVSATRHADLRRWLAGELADTTERDAAADAAREKTRAAAEEQLARMEAEEQARFAAAAERQAQLEQERAAIRQAAAAKAAAERPVMDLILGRLAAATEFETIEAKRVAGVGGGRPTALAFDRETGVRVDATRFLRVVEEQSSHRVTLYRVEVPKAASALVKVSYWWNRDRTVEVG